MLSVIVSDCIN